MIIKNINHIFLGGKMDYLIAYDIEDNKNRSKVFEMLKDFGLRAVQKSVFFGELSNAEKIEIKIFLSKYCDKNDKVIITKFDLKFEDLIGYEKSDFEKLEFHII